MYACLLSRFTCIQLSVTLWTVALQAPLSMEFSKQEYWNGLLCPPPGDLPNPGIKPGSPALQADSLLIELVISIQVSNPALPCCRQILYQLGQQGSPTWCIQSAKIEKKTTCQSRILYLGKLPFKSEGEIKTSPEKQKLRE